MSGILQAYFPWKPLSIIFIFISTNSGDIFTSKQIKSQQGPPEPSRVWRMAMWPSELVRGTQPNSVMGKRIRILAWRMDGRIPILRRAAEVTQKEGKWIIPFSNLNKFEDPHFSYPKTEHNGISGFCEARNKPIILLPLNFVALSARGAWAPYLLVKILLVL